MQWRVRRGELQKYPRRVTRREEALGMPAGSEGGHVGDGECTHKVRIVCPAPCMRTHHF